jgi:hypothetical protein
VPGQDIAERRWGTHQVNTKNIFITLEKVRNPASENHGSLSALDSRFHELIGIFAPK